MSLRLQISLIFMAPVLILAGLYALGVSLPVPMLGRDYVIRFVMPSADTQVNLPEVLGPNDKTRPLVVIDAGHGGKDPGASARGYREKDVVLGLAKALRDRLLAEGGIRVALTREDDSFLVLQERPEIARRLNADLFISIHANSSGEVSGVSGASIYTLSEQASSEAAARFAERENSANSLNGVVVSDRNPQLNDILVELSQRRVQESSAEFAGLITREGEGRLKFHPNARRSAALAVLRAPDVPAVLYKSGYITDPSDVTRLTSEEGRRQFAEVMAQAIRIYFARQRSGTVQQ